MSRRIYGYYFTITVEKGELGHMSYAPGVGGVYEEGATIEEATSNAYEAACAIFEARLERNDPIVKDNAYLKVLTLPPARDYLDNIDDVPGGYVVTSPYLVRA